ncbi:phosphotransferase [Corynebacterium anserum]|uniref:Phosphotransferase n=1 Tax=Corynebacterium anserum TaxID=2684406 RepID=A0A7G7YNJ5_9CORY|nr:phosphotransferase [Corynebacterium anserum]QNH96065.1 phosphotransferase [Corynebacterium anserum]
MHTVDKAVDCAAKLLAMRFGGTPQLTHPEDLGGSGASMVIRCRVAPNPFLQERSVVIKQLPDFPSDGEQVDGPTADELALIREIVAYQYTNTLPEHSRPGPLLLAYDVEKHMLILSDAGDGLNFTDVLLMNDADERKTAVRKLGRALGRMHATTYGGAESYNTLLRRQCQKHGINPSTIVDSDIDIANLVREGVNLMEANDVHIDPIVLQYANEAAERQGRFDFRSFTPFDLTPDNIMLTKQVVFLDYEWASFRDIAFDVASVIVGFPQDHSTPALTEEECTEFLSAWSAEVSHVWPETRDFDRVVDKLMAPLIGWALMSLVMLHRGNKMSRKASRRIQHSSDTRYRGAADIALLTPEQASDLATTVDAIHRFALHYPNPRFEAVAKFTGILSQILARQGGHPMRHEP